MHDPTKHPGSHHEHKAQAPASVACFVVTSSDTRDEATDSGGALICDLLAGAGHTVAGRTIIKDDPVELLALLAKQVPASRAQAVFITGGTGLGRRDTTVETLLGRFQKKLDGFGELFRMLSFQEIGSPAMMSRAVAGTLDGRIVFALPGSPNAIRLAMERLILPELGHVVREMTR